MKQQRTVMIVSFMNPPPLTIQDKLLNGFFRGILIQPICHPVLYKGLPGTFRAAIAMRIINPVVHESQASPMEHTLVFGYSQADWTAPLRLPFIHRIDSPTLPLVLTRTGWRLDWNQVLKRRPNLWDGSCRMLRSPKWWLVVENTTNTIIVTCKVP